MMELDEEESRMLKRQRQGVISVIATPHYSAEYRNKKEENLSGTKIRKRAREEINPKFSIYPEKKSFIHRIYC